jgi:hypothetical protein
MFIVRVLGRFVSFAVRAVLFVAAVAVVGAVVVTTLFDADQFKRQLTQKIVDVTGRSATIGQAELQLTVPPRLVLNNVQLKNAQWGSRPNMAQLKKVTVKLDPLSAISGGNAVAQVDIEGADIVLESAAGENNWTAAGVLGGGAGAGVMGALGILGAPVTLSEVTLTVIGSIINVPIGPIIGCP